VSAVILNGDGRFILLNKPAAFPFKDMVTGTPEGPVFDLSVDFDGFDGVGYIKAEHVIEMARTLGMATTDEVIEMRARIAELEAREHELPAHVERLLNGINDSVVNFRNFPALVGIDAPVYLLDSFEGNEGEQGESSAESGIDTSDQSAESGSDDGEIPESPFKDNKPSSNKRSAKLSASSDDGFGFNT
jgi:hypothetical protein